VGFIAIKDFRVYNRKCSNVIYDFESGLSGWTTDGAPNNYLFQVVTASATASTTKVDHTERSSYGHVSYLPTATANSVSHFVSPQMAALQQQCFTFWFIRSGLGVNLALYMVPTANKVYSNPIWQNNRTHLAGEWIRVQTTVLITNPINFIFEAKTGKSIILVIYHCHSSNT